MEHDFWHRRWARRDIGFHEGVPNRMLTRHIDALALPARARVFVPLCGKSQDMAWLLGQGYRVAGAELSPIAVQEFFAEHGLEPVIVAWGTLTLYRAPDLDIFVGDIFDLTGDVLGPVDAVHDRAALIALPPQMRGRYARHVADLAHGARQLVTCIEYDPSLLQGPPFAVAADEVALHYGQAYDLTLVERAEIDGGFRGVPAADAVWLMAPKALTGAERSASAATRVRSL